MSIWTCSIDPKQTNSLRIDPMIIASEAEEQSSDYIEDDLPTEETNNVAASGSVNPALDNTPLADDHDLKFPRQALRDFSTQGPLFSSVCAAAGIIEHERLAIAVTFEREGSGHGKTSS